METITSSPVSLGEKISHLFQASREYVESKVELEVLKGADKIARGTSALVTFLIGMAFSIVLVLLLCIGGAIAINVAMDSAFAGYFIMAGIIALVLVCVFTFGRNSIRKMVVDAILKNIDND